MTEKTLNKISSVIIKFKERTSVYRTETLMFFIQFISSDSWRHCPAYSPSLFMPACTHLCSLHALHWFLCVLSTTQLPSHLALHTYCLFLLIDLCNNKTAYCILYASNPIQKIFWKILTCEQVFL